MEINIWIKRRRRMNVRGKSREDMKQKWIKPMKRGASQEPHPLLIGGCGDVTCAAKPFEI